MPRAWHLLAMYRGGTLLYSLRLMRWARRSGRAVLSIAYGWMKNHQEIFIVKQLLEL